MSLERAVNHLKTYGFEDKIIIPEEGSPTVEAAAHALGCEPARIAKSLAFLLADDQPVLVVAEGTARVDNRKFKDFFRQKAKMIPWDQVNHYIGHEPGGVCPFGVNENVKIYLDVSLRKFDIVYPAAGNNQSAVKLTLPELETCSNYLAWVDVCKET